MAIPYNQGLHASAQQPAVLSPVEDAPIGRQINILGKTLTELCSLVQDITNRTTSVLNIPGPAVEGQSAPTPREVLGPVAESIREHRESVERICSQLRFIRDTLEC